MLGWEVRRRVGERELTVNADTPSALTLLMLGMVRMTMASTRVVKLRSKSDPTCMTADSIFTSELVLYVL